MTSYKFQISNGSDFSDEEDLPDDEAAWREALKTVRDIEATLNSKGGDWALVVTRGDVPLYRIDVKARRLA
jgi:hypothetical protein